MSKIIPFYGANDPELFEIERRCMDRDGKVIACLDRLLPSGRILDAGAGNGFTAHKLCGTHRTIIPMEPAAGMIDNELSFTWVRGVTQQLPFRNNVFNAVYATWAFFLPGVSQRSQGIEEIKRVMCKNGICVIVDNAGDDDFCAFSQQLISDNGNWYCENGFSREVIETSFRFDSVEEARTLMTFYFGDTAQQICKKEFLYRVAVYTLKNIELK